MSPSPDQKKDRNADRNSDLDHVERVLAGDTAAFEPIVRRWQAPLVNLAYRFCHDRGRAEDMAQEAFLRAFRALSQWRKDAAFSTWLFALATNLYRSEIRRIPALMVSLDPTNERRAGEPHGDWRGPDHDIDDADRDRALRNAVSALPARYRDAVILFYFHEMNLAATAQSLRLPEGTIKARLSRARDLIRRKLTARAADPQLKEA